MKTETFGRFQTRISGIDGGRLAASGREGGSSTALCWDGGWDVAMLWLLQAGTEKHGSSGLRRMTQLEIEMRLQNPED